MHICSAFSVSFGAHLECTSNKYTGHWCLWKKGIRHGDISLGNLMWDDRRKVGVLNDFDLARFADQKGASGQDNTGTMPYMALDLLSVKGLRGEIPRLYRHEAESFAWSLICLHFATVEDEGGKNRTRNPHPLDRWFGDWRISRDAKLKWPDPDEGKEKDVKKDKDPPLAYPETRDLASALHVYWLNRYKKQFPNPSERADRPQLPADEPEEAEEEVLARKFNVDPMVFRDSRVPLYEELTDEAVFLEVMVVNVKELRRLVITKGIAFEMGGRYGEIDWAT